MKRIALVFALSLAALLPQTTHAQIHVNVNLGAQPLWGPVGYNQANYYYLPDIDTYYDVANKQYIYMNNGQWAFSNTLPAKYSSYNLYNGYKVVLNTPKPYLNYNTDKVKYVKYKGAKSQPVIKYSADPKYKTIHTNVNGVPPGQAKKIVVNSGQRTVIAGSNGERTQNGKIKVKDHEDDRDMERMNGNGNGNNGNGNKEGNDKDHGKGKGKD